MRLGSVGVDAVALAEHDDALDLRVSVVVNAAVHIALSFRSLGSPDAFESTLSPESASEDRTDSTYLVCQSLTIWSKYCSPGRG